MSASIRFIIVAAAMDGRDVTTFAHARCVIRACSPDAVYLVHVVESLGHEGAAQAAVGPVEDAAVREKLHALTAHLGVAPPANVELVVAHGDVTEALVKLARRTSADLLCVGRSVDSRADESTRGAVRVLRKSPCSVLIVPAGADVGFDRIVAAVDFSRRSGEAVELAARLVPAGKPITALYVYSAPLGYHKLGQTFEQAAAAMRVEAEADAREWLDSLDLGGARCQMRYAAGDEVPRKIADEADALDAGLIVVASHGRTQPAALVLGHVADAVCRKTTRPMLCIKRKGEVVNLIQAIAQLYEWD